MRAHAYIHDSALDIYNLVYLGGAGIGQKSGRLTVTPKQNTAYTLFAGIGGRECYGKRVLFIKVGPAKTKVRLTVEVAEGIALKLHPGTITRRKLEKEHGLLRYAFQIKTSEGITPVRVDAETGEIVGTMKPE